MLMSKNLSTRDLNLGKKMKLTSVSSAEACLTSLCD